MNAFECVGVEVVLVLGRVFSHSRILIAEHEKLLTAKCAKDAKKANSLQHWCFRPKFAKTFDAEDDETPGRFPKRAANPW
jgi:hypothetical protein